MKDVFLLVAGAALVLAATACTHGDDHERPDIAGDSAAATSGDMAQVASFGSNPGALVMYEYVPPGLPGSAPLVVVLHGCLQSAVDMVHAGWNDLADEFGFAVVYAEQATANNPLRCFNWAGEYGDVANMTRGQGENLSIKQMVDTMISTHGIDPGQVYVSGFSAGAGMAAVLLATWPDVFSAGAIQSGIPYQCANTVDTAYDCQQMNQNPGRKRSASEWGELVRSAHPGYAGPYPRVTIWHGLNDTFVVHHENMVELVEQWTNVHGVDTATPSTEQVSGHQHDQYQKNGVAVVESWAITGMAHAIVFGVGDPEHPCGPTGFAQYYADHDVCSTYRIAAFFGVLGDGPPTPTCTDQPECNPTIPDDTEPPTVDVLTPGHGDKVANTVSISVSADDDVAIDRVELYIDGSLQLTDRSAPYGFDWPTAAFGDGEHSVMAIAYDVAGNLAVDDDTSVVVDNGGGGGNGSGGAGGEGQDEYVAGCSSSGGDGGGLVLLALLFTLLFTRARRGRQPPHRE